VLLFYPGSFDPLHNGHLDIITRAARLGPLVIGVGTNPAKEPLLGSQVRCEHLRGAVAGLHDVTVVPYALSTLAQARVLGATSVVRGIRNTTDLEFEATMAAIHRAHGLETVFLLSDGRFTHLSSRAVRLALSAGIGINDMVPAAVATALERRLAP